MGKNDLDKALQETRKKLQVPAYKENQPLEDVIMIVDDDGNLIKSLEFIFKNKYKVISCYGGVEAVDKYKKLKNKIHTVLLDIKMDDKNGIDVYKEIKKLNPTIPVIFNTAYPGEYKPLDLVQTLHPFGYIIKGTNPSILYDNISSAIEYYKLINEKDILNIKLKNIISDLKKLHKASQKLTSILDRDKLFKEIYKQYSNITHSRYVLFFPFDNNQWNLINANAIKNKEIKDALIKVSNILISEIEKTKKEIIINDPVNDKRIKSLFKKDSLGKFIKNIFAIPLIVHENLAGVIIIVNNKEGKIDSNSNYYLFETLSNQISIVLKNISMIEEKIKDKELSTIGEMTYTIIHDINNPLTIIKSCAELIKMEGNKEMQEYAEGILSEFDRLMVMIAELVEFIKKGSSKLNLSKHKLSSIITDHCRRIRKSFSDKNIGIDLKLDYSGFLTIDKNKFLRILQNLLCNARNAVGENGKITILTKENDNFAEIIVNDTGKGMSKKTKESIFEPFFTKRQKTGLGLGLGMYIVKQLVSQHNGTIEIDSRINKGTTFTIKLPLN